MCLREKVCLLVMFKGSSYDPSLLRHNSRATNPSLYVIDELTIFALRNVIFFKLLNGASELLLLPLQYGRRHHICIYHSRVCSFGNCKSKLGIDTNIGRNRLGHQQYSIRNLN